MIGAPAAPKGQGGAARDAANKEMLPGFVRSNRRERMSTTRRFVAASLTAMRSACVPRLRLMLAASRR